MTESIKLYLNSSLLSILKSPTEERHKSDVRRKKKNNK